jgi:hypothetical protein
MAPAWCSTSATKTDVMSGSVVMLKISKRKWAVDRIRAISRVTTLQLELNYADIVEYGWR